MIESHVDSIPTNDTTALAKEQMYADFDRLLHASDEVRKRWRGSKSDLFEMAYRTYYNNRITDDSGVPLPFSRVCTIVCDRFHIHRPQNIYTFALMACRREGVRAHTLLKKYEWRIKRLAP